MKVEIKKNSEHIELLGENGIKQLEFVLEEVIKHYNNYLIDDFVNTISNSSDFTSLEFTKFSKFCCFYKEKIGIVPIAINFIK